MPAESDNVPAVLLFTDGACLGNPGSGGWAYILRHPASGKEKESFGNQRDTTNNQMELRAVIEGLKALKQRSRVELYSDSKYVLDGLSSWMRAWKAKGWRLSSKKPVKNVELWQELDLLVQEHDVSFHWIRGHAGHPENERCDFLSVEAAKQV